MFRAVRVIVYEFEDEQRLAQQLGRSLNEGQREFSSGCSISVANVPDALLFALSKAIPQIEEALGKDYQSDRPFSG